MSDERERAEEGGSDCAAGGAVPGGRGGAAALLAVDHQAGRAGGVVPVAPLPGIDRRHQWSKGGAAPVDRGRRDWARGRWAAEADA